MEIKILICRNIRLSYECSFSIFESFLYKLSHRVKRYMMSQFCVNALKSHFFQNLFILHAAAVFLCDGREKYPRTSS